MEQQTWRQQDVKQANGIGCNVYVTSCTYLFSKVGRQFNLTRTSSPGLKSLWSTSTTAQNNGQNLRVASLQFLCLVLDPRAQARAVWVRRKKQRPWCRKRSQCGKWIRNQEEYYCYSTIARCTGVVRMLCWYVFTSCGLASNATMRRQCKIRTWWQKCQCGRSLQQTIPRWNHYSWWWRVSKMCKSNLRQVSKQISWSWAIKSFTSSTQTKNLIAWMELPSNLPLLSKINWPAQWMSQTSS